MGRTLRTAGAVALVLGTMLGIGTADAGAGATVAGSARGSRTPRPPAQKPKPAPPPGWIVDTISVDPLDANQNAITVTGLGSYRGRVVLARTANGVGVRNDVPLEEYMRGISEVPSSWPFEALKAQAVAARTYALWEASRPTKTAAVAAFKNVGADICATESCQVYTGTAKVEAPDGGRWAAAVEATHGQVLWWRGGPINAKYSSSNGGESIPGGQPYLRAVADPDDVYSPLHHWQVTLGFDAIGHALGMTTTPVALQRAGDTIVVTGTPTLDGAPPETVTLEVNDFGEKVNGAIAPPAGLPRTVPSTRFDVLPVTNGVVLDGRAFGHGIGMSQWGAYGKAARGMKAPDILAAYYGGLKPVDIPVAGLADAQMRVAVGVDLPNAEVSAGSFRITAADGTVIAHAATGAWRIEPAPGETTKLRVVAPPDQQAVKPVEHVTTTPSTPKPGDAVTVTLRLPEAAMLTAAAAPPQPAALGAATPIRLADPRLLAAGDVTLHLPPAQTAGQYQVSIETDLGGGRTNTTTLAITVVDPSSSATRVAARTIVASHSQNNRAPRSLPAAAVAVALLTLLAVASATALAGLRTRSPLH
jgi:stage II sporulation protein D